MAKASKRGHTQAIRLLLDYGAEVNTVDVYGASPLDCAATSGHIDSVRMLLSVDGIDINTQRSEKSKYHGNTPLQMAES